MSGPGEASAVAAPFDIASQVWAFDPEDFGVTIDGSWHLCWLGDPDDYPCVVDEDVDRMTADVIACGHAIAALPQLVRALRDMRRRFHAALIEGGTDREFADAACERADMVLAQVAGGARG